MATAVEGSGAVALIPPVAIGDLEFEFLLDHDLGEDSVEVRRVQQPLRSGRGPVERVRVAMCPDVYEAWDEDDRCFDYVLERVKSKEWNVGVYHMRDVGPYAAHRARRVAEANKPKVDQVLDDLEGRLDALLSQLGELNRQPTPMQWEAFATRFRGVSRELEHIQSRIAQIDTLHRTVEAAFLALVAQEP